MGKDVFPALILWSAFLTPAQSESLGHGYFNPVNQWMYLKLLTLRSRQIFEIQTKIHSNKYTQQLELYTTVLCVGFHSKENLHFDVEKSTLLTHFVDGIDTFCEWGSALRRVWLLYFVNKVHRWPDRRCFGRNNGGCQNNAPDITV